MNRLRPVALLMCASVCVPACGGDAAAGSLADRVGPVLDQAKGLAQQLADARQLEATFGRLRQQLAGLGDAAAVDRTKAGLSRLLAEVRSQAAQVDAAALGDQALAALRQAVADTRTAIANSPARAEVEQALQPVLDALQRALAPK